MKRLLPLLLALCSLSLAVAVVATLAWYRSAKSPVALERLSPEQRQHLTEEMVSLSAGVFEPAWYEPALGYTLRRDAEITAWNDTFKSNEIGFRSGPVAKKDGAFRVLFVGDSWTFGMGVREVESFPKVFERLAREQGTLDGKVEAWTLALPGWNTLAELSALWFFFDRLQPDAVVFCPTSNDNHSLARVLPNGSLANVGLTRDEFGDEVGLTYPWRHLDSYRFGERWRISFRAFRDSEQRLGERGVPVWFYFVARWQEAYAHALVAEAGLRSPYFFAPRKLTMEPWLNPPPVLHGTAEANRLFGGMVYDAVASGLGWPALPATVERPRVPLFGAPPPDAEWRGEAARLVINETREQISSRFVPSPEAWRQVAGPIDAASGLMGRATAILVRRPESVGHLVLTVRKVAEAPSLVPFELTVTIPSPNGGTRWVEVIPAAGDERHTFTVPLPTDVAAGAALDVVLVASRTAQAPGVLAARSLYLEAIEPVP